MALNTNKVLKTYYSIKEVGEIFNLPEPTLRYWETEFPSLKPRTTKNKVRQYTQKDITQPGESAWIQDCCRKEDACIKARRRGEYVKDSRSPALHQVTTLRPEGRIGQDSVRTYPPCLTGIPPPQWRKT